MKRVFVFTDNMYLYRKAVLELPYATVILSDEKAGINDSDIIIKDKGREGGKQKLIIIKDGEESVFHLPAPIGALGEAVLGGYAPRKRIELVPSQNAVSLDTKTVKLTQIEYLLFEKLYIANGEFVSRDELLCDVWGGESDSGVINVYIHYLRTKLEFSGEKIIISSRGGGYKIDKKYLGA